MPPERCPKSPPVSEMQLDMQEWKDGGEADGGMEGWRDGGMEGWRDGGMEGWRRRVKAKLSGGSGGPSGFHIQLP